MVEFETRICLSCEVTIAVIAGVHCYQPGCQCALVNLIIEFLVHCNYI